MTHIFNNRIGSRRPPDGPLAPWFHKFAEWMSAQGYARGTIGNCLMHIARFNGWLAGHGIELSSISSEVATQYLQARDPNRVSCAPSSLRHLLGYLQSAGVLSVVKPLANALTAVERCVMDFKRHLRCRNLAPGTICLYATHAENFLHHRFADGEVQLLWLNIDDVIAFVRHEAVRLSSRDSLKSVMTALRAFLRYVHAHADRMPNLVGAVPAVANWSMTSVPRGISADQTAMLLASIDRGTPLGRRDYAILLLLSRLGLRAIEVARLTLDDIDWHNAMLSVTLKTGVRSAYPLDEKIGEAIVEYLQHARPQSDDRRVFLRVRAPFRGFNDTVVFRNSLRNWIKRAAVEAPTGGTHQFRHGLATQMLCNGASLAQISDVLGHRNIDTTRIYAKVDIEALRTLALPWPGGVQ